MITGFEKQTQEITEDEKKAARVAYKVMKLAFKKGDTITNSTISNAIKLATGQKLSGSRIRKIIAWMHHNGHLPRLTASSTGYGWAKSRDELLSYIESLAQRNVGIQMRIDAAKKGLKEMP